MQGGYLQAFLLLLLCSCQLLRSQVREQLDGAIAGALVQGAALGKGGEAALNSGAPAGGEPGVLIRLAS